MNNLVNSIQNSLSITKPIVKHTKFNKLKMKVNNSGDKIPDACTLIQTNQCNTGKQNLEKKNRDVDKKKSLVMQKLLKLRIRHLTVFSYLLLFLIHTLIRSGK